MVLTGPLDTAVFRECLKRKNPGAGRRVFDTEAVFLILDFRPERRGIRALPAKPALVSG